MLELVPKVGGLCRYPLLGLFADSPLGLGAGKLSLGRAVLGFLGLGQCLLDGGVDTALAARRGILFGGLGPGLGLLLRSEGFRELSLGRRALLVRASKLLGGQIARADCRLELGRARIARFDGRLQVGCWSVCVSGRSGGLLLGRRRGLLGTLLGFCGALFGGVDPLLAFGLDALELCGDSLVGVGGQTGSQLLACFRLCLFADPPLDLVHLVTQPLGGARPRLLLERPRGPRVASGRLELPPRTLLAFPARPFL